MKKLNYRQIFLLIAVMISLISIYVAYEFQTQSMPQASIFVLTDAAVPKEGQKILVFAPHPDDETLGAGGLIAESIRNKADVRIVLITDGNKHGLRETRYREFRKATTMLGVTEDKLVFLGYPDGKLRRQNREAVTAALKTQIDQYQPDFVVYPEPKDSHPDHAIAGEIISGILDEENSKVVRYKYLVHFRYFPAPFAYAPKRYLLPPWRMINTSEQWEKLMLPSDVEALKNQTVRIYKSQIDSHIPFDASMMLAPVRKNELFETKN